MKLIAAPARLFKTWSLILTILTGLFDLAFVLVKTLSDLHFMSTETFGAINAGLVFLIGAARFIQQQIATTTAQKVALIKAASKQPVKKGQVDVTTEVTKDPPKGAT